MDISILSRPRAIPVLLYVSRNPGCGKTSPSYTPGGCIDHSREARINEFIECGLMEIDLHGRTKHRKSLYLTLKGREVSERLEEIEMLLGGTQPFPRAS